MEFKAEHGRSPMQLLDDSLAVLAFVMVGTRIPIVDAEPHGVVEQHRDLACCCCYGLGLSDARRQATVERAERRIRPTHSDGRKSQMGSYPVGSLARVC